MIDLKKIRNNPDEIKVKMENRGESFDLSLIDEVVELDQKRRNILIEVEELKNKRNKTSAEVPKLKKQGIDVSETMKEMKQLSDTIKNYDLDLNEIDQRIEYIMMRIPNIPHDSVPNGSDDEDNVEIKKWGEIRKFDF